jgi:anthranilate phosphoribosyltransferase
VHELVGSADGSADGPDGGSYATSTYRIDPAELGFAPATLDDLRGGDASVNAEAIRRVIAGDPSPHRDIAVLNAAAALVVVGQSADLPAGIDLAGSVIDDGRAASVLESLIRVSREESAAESAA